MHVLGVVWVNSGRLGGNIAVTRTWFGGGKKVLALLPLTKEIFFRHLLEGKREMYLFSTLFGISQN